MAQSGIDREKQTPSLIRVFVREGQHLTNEAYADPFKLPSSQIHVHTWMDATLEELCDLVASVRDEVRKAKRCIISFALVYPDRKGKMVVKPVAQVEYPDHFSQEKDMRRKSLSELKFEIGDFLDVAIRPI